MISYNQLLNLKDKWCKYCVVQKKDKVLCFFNLHYVIYLALNLFINIRDRSVLYRILRSRCYKLKSKFALLNRYITSSLALMSNLSQHRFGPGLCYSFTSDLQFDYAYEPCKGRPVKGSVKPTPPPIKNLNLHPLSVNIRSSGTARWAPVSPF